MQNFETQEQLLQKRLAQAQAMRDQEFTPAQSQMVGGRFIRPDMSSALVQGLRAYRGMKESGEAEQQLGDLQKQKQEAIAKALRTFGEKANPSQLGTGATNLVNDALPPEMQIGAQPALAPRKPDLYGAYQSLADSGVADLQKAGMQGFLQMPQIQAQQQEREDARTFRQQEAQAAREARAQELQMRIQDARASQAERLQAQKELREMQIQAQKDTQRMIAANRPAPQTQTLQTDSGMLERGPDGKWRPITIDGKPVMPKGGAGGGNATEGERKAATLLQRMQNSEAQLEQALKANPNAAKPGIVQQGLSAMGMGTTANMLTPEARQQVEAAQLDILDSALTLGTGAAYTKEQLEGYRKSYFPQIGDKPQTIKDKQDRLNNVLSAARIAAGRAAGQVTAPTPQSGIDALLEKYK